MYKKILPIIIFILIFICGILFLLLKSPTATIDHHTFIIDIAKTSREQEIGLAKYVTLPKDHAMYFPFAYSDYYAFWMKNMHFPIDMLFIQNGKIVTIYKNVPVPKNNNEQLPIYRPTAPVNAVLEINAGLAKTYGFRINDRVIISY